VSGVSAGILEGGSEGITGMIEAPFLNLKAQYATIRSAVREAVDRVCESQHFILGPEVAALEEAVAAFCGSVLPSGCRPGVMLSRQR
jgi:hypothetical protein